MSQTNNTTVFVFGAGVSAPAGFPLSKGLFSEFKDYISQRAGDDFYDALRGQWKELEERKVFDSWLDIETNLTRLDIEGRKDQDLVYLRGHIGDAFTEYFNEKHRQILSNKGAIDYLREFVRKHVKANDVIITFNYDCLIERVLHEAGLWTVLDGYGFPRVLKSSKGGPPEPPSSVKVLKLHGSLGWISGVLKDQDILFIQNKALGFAGYTQSEDSGYQRGGSRPAIVLPSYVKLLDVHPLPLIWRQAAEALRKAARAVLIGYSMPSADSAALMLLLTNISAAAQVIHCWLNDRQRAEEVVNTFEAAGIKPLDRKCTIQDPIF